MRKFLMASFACLLSACIQTPVRQAPTQEQLAAEERAVEAMLDCGRKYVAETDDGTSDATTIALALAIRCVSEYNAVTEAFVASRLNNDDQRRMFRDKRATQERRVEDFLPIVMRYRKAIKPK